MNVLILIFYIYVYNSIYFSEINFLIFLINKKINIAIYIIDIIIMFLTIILFFMLKLLNLEYHLNEYIQSNDREDSYQENERLKI